MVMVMLMLETMLSPPENVWFFNIFVNIYQSPARISGTRSDSSHHVDSCNPLWVCHNSVNVSGNVIMLVEMAMVMLVVQCSQ
jgi:hypothetical protein